MADNIIKARIDTLHDREGNNVYPRTTIDALVDSKGNKVYILYADENNKVPIEMLPDMSGMVDSHNSDDSSHTDIRALITDLYNRLNNINTMSDLATVEVID